MMTTMASHVTDHVFAHVTTVLVACAKPAYQVENSVPSRTEFLYRSTIVRSGVHPLSPSDIELYACETHAVCMLDCDVAQIPAAPDNQ
jgi:hypothetical protein